MVKKLTPKQKRELIKLLSGKRASGVKYSRGHLSLKFDGRALKNRIIMRHDPGIGNWARKRHVIYYDEHVLKKDILPILLHETIEKYAAQTYGLHTQSEAHKVAMNVEKHFVMQGCCSRFKKDCKHGMDCWMKHEERIQAAWLRENHLITGRPKSKLRKLRHLARIRRRIRISAK